LRYGVKLVGTLMDSGYNTHLFKKGTCFMVGVSTHLHLWWLTTSPSLLFLSSLFFQSFFLPTKFKGGFLIFLHKILSSNNLASSIGEHWWVCLWVYIYSYKKREGKEFEIIPSFMFAFLEVWIWFILLVN